MFPYVLRRFIQLIPTFLLSTVLIFAIVQAAPGDFLTPLKADPSVKPQTIARLTKQYGLDKPVVVQYGYWMKNLLRGDLGESFQAKRPVAEILKPRIINSLILVVISTVILYLVAIPIGVYGALKPYSFLDRVFSILSSLASGFHLFSLLSWSSMAWLELSKILVGMFLFLENQVRHWIMLRLYAEVGIFFYTL